MRLGINLIKDVQELHQGDYKTLLRDIKETCLNEKICHVYDLIW